MRDKLKYVIDVITTRLAELDAEWGEVTQVDLYAAADISTYGAARFCPRSAARLSPVCACTVHARPSWEAKWSWKHEPWRKS